MRKILLILFVCYQSIAQNNAICGELNYTQVLGIGFGYVEKEHYKLTFNNEMSYAKEVDITANESKKKKEMTKETVNDNGNLIKQTLMKDKRSNTTPKFYYNTQKKFYYLTILDNEDIVVKEAEHKWDWQLKKETKEISGFLCQKAIIDFRGRTYVAWYTEEIPVPYGPWKFQGLPGLILEVYDLDKTTFHVTPTKIKVGREVYCKVHVKEDVLKHALSVEEFAKKRKEILHNIKKRMRSRIPKGYKIKENRECDDCPKKELEDFGDGQ